MTPVDAAFFPTDLGPCGLAWSDRGLVGVQLPSASGAQATRAALLRRFPEAKIAVAPPAVEAAITAHLRGEAADLTAIALDDNASGAWDRAVHAATRAIPRGTTRTYGEIAAMLHEPGAARAVAQALSRNPWPIVVPCHRVIGAGATLGGFSAPGGATTKRRLLEIEGAFALTDLPLFEPRRLPAVSMNNICATKRRDNL